MILMTLKIENMKMMMMNTILIAANMIEMTIGESDDTDDCNRKHEIGINRPDILIKFVVLTTSMMIILTIISWMTVFN
jgi:hypothetical protein